MRIQGFWGQSLITIVLLLITSIQAKKQLDKPVVFKDGLNALKDGLKKHLPVPKYRVYPWKPGWTMEDCKVEAPKGNVTSLDKIKTYHVYYDDCDKPWTICHHSDSSDSLLNVIENFGRIPVRARSYVNGALSLRANADEENNAWMADAIMVLFYKRNPKHKNKPGDGQSSTTVFIHETGHALDRLAYRNYSRLSSRPEYKSQYAKDSKVIDDYAGSNFGENVAQNTVIATYDLAVPGGLPSATKDWQSVKHQLEFMKRKQKEAGNILVANGRCGPRRQDKKPVRIPLPKGKKRTRRDASVLSTVHLDDEVDPEKMLNVDRSKGSKVIMPRLKFDTEHVCEARDL